MTIDKCIDYMTHISGMIESQPQTDLNVKLLEAISTTCFYLGEINSAPRANTSISDYNKAIYDFRHEVLSWVMDNKDFDGNIDVTDTRKALFDITRRLEKH